MEPTIFSSPDSYDSRVIRWMALEKECPVDYRTVQSYEVSLDKLPNIQDRDLYLVEHEAIVQYLQERYPGEPLLPSDPKVRGQLRQICMLVRKGDRNLIGDLEKLLYNKGPYITGGEFTLADIYIGVRLHELNISRNKSAPQLAAYYNRLAGRQAFKDAME